MLSKANALRTLANRLTAAPLVINNSCCQGSGRRHWAHNHRAYDSFGNLENETNAAVDHVMGFTGQQFDDETELAHHRARYYDPSISRFLSQDPTSFAGGDANLYRYVGNSPIIFVDPSGLAAQAATGGQQIQLGSAGQTGPTHQEHASILFGPAQSFGGDQNIFAGATIDTFSGFVDDLGDFGSAIQDIPGTIQNIGSHFLDFADDPVGNIKGSIFALGEQLSTGRGVGQFLAEIVTGRKIARTLAPLTKSPKLALASGLDNLDRANPRDIRFSQDTISPNFEKGGTITELVNRLRKGKTTPDEIKPIRVVEKNGKLYSMDNRRLSAFKTAQVDDVPIERVNLDDHPLLKEQFNDRFRPIKDGTAIVVTLARHRAAARNVLRTGGVYGTYPIE